MRPISVSSKPTPKGMAKPSIPLSQATNPTEMPGINQNSPCPTRMQHTSRLHYWSTAPMQGPGPETSMPKQQECNTFLKMSPLDSLLGSKTYRQLTPPAKTSCQVNPRAFTPDGLSSLCSCPRAAQATALEY